VLAEADKKMNEICFGGWSWGSVRVAGATSETAPTGLELEVPSLMHREAGHCPPECFPVL